MKHKRTEDGWIIFYEGRREIIRIQLPDGGITRAELKAFEKHLLAHLQGAN